MTTFPADWDAALAKHGLGSAKVDRLLDAAYEPRQGTVYPPRHLALRAFELTRLMQVKAVVLGQDPYYRHPDQAHGLSFSVPALDPALPTDIRIPPALYSIFRNLERMTASDPLHPFIRPQHGDLSGWAAKGVLLLNTALTVRAGLPESHLHIWQDFTAAVIAALRDTGQPIAFMLWGEWARGYAATITRPAQAFLMPHPAYRPAKGEKNVWRSGLRRPFAEVNSFLVQNHRDEIDWSLP